MSEARGRRARDAFLRFPWRIYANDPQWVPPLLMERKEFINAKKHPFLLHGAATQFLAFRRGLPVGVLRDMFDGLTGLRRTAGDL